MKHLRIKVYGIVQGVFFRNTTLSVARQLGIKGYVRNEEDGSVAIAAEGRDSDLEEFIAYCKVGPEAAVVEDIVIEEGSIENHHEFEIIR